MNDRAWQDFSAITLFLVGMFASESVMAIDLDSLWDYSRPALSEQRFAEALAGATGDDALILRTQIARAHGLRRDFTTARVLLHQVAPQVGAAGAEARARYQLELGRTYASAMHDPACLTAEDLLRARSAFEEALKTAQTAKLDGLAIDAIHMFAFLDTAPTDQLKWGQAALDIVLASTQPGAKRWEPSVRNNIGYSLHQLGRYEEALEQFRLAAQLRERGTNPEATRVAHWMIAWTLRSLGRLDEALEIQLRLERENAAAGNADPHVFEELAALYAAKGDKERADHYARLHAASGKP